MKKKPLLLTVFICFFGCSLAAGADDFASKMDGVMDHFDKLDYFSGVVLVAHEGEVLYAKAFGEADKDFHIPNTLQTRFELGSIAKLFTGIAVLKLVDEGRIGLNDPVQKHLPDFPFGDRITILHLLSHTSGLPDWTSHPRFRSIWSQVRTIDQMKALVFDQKLKHESPGEKFEYSSSGFILLGAVLERIHGKSYAAVIKDNILDPLEMKETSIANPENVVENRASGYVKSSTGRFSTNVYWLLPFVASAGIQTTAGDMLKLDQALYGGKLLSRETQDMIYKPGVDKNWGILWRLGEAGGNRIVWHGGETTGVSAMFRRYLDDKYTLIILSNYHRAGRPLTRVVEPLLFGRPYELPKPTLREYLFREMMESGTAITLQTFDGLIKKAGYAVESANDLNGLGYELMDEERMEMALKIFKLNCFLFPDAANTYDSLAEACLRIGDPGSALANYEKALEIDPESASAKSGLERVKTMLKK
jgi:CubicO group peptidase (beta-lactamase class C family)